jgi:hypothetical protein
MRVQHRIPSVFVDEDSDRNQSSSDKVPEITVYDTKSSMLRLRKRRRGR